MTENKMEAVAQLFGKKLGEKFVIKGRYKDNLHCMFWLDGLLYHDGVRIEWLKSADYMLTDLLTGEAVIINE